MTIERSNITQYLQRYLWHILSIMLIPGIAGIMFPTVRVITAMTLVFSVTLIPGCILVYHADQILFRKNPIIACTASVLTSITILIIYLLVCEVLHIPLTISEELPYISTDIFQAGILLYTEGMLILSAIFSRYLIRDQDMDHSRIGKEIPITFIIILLIIGFFTCTATIILSENSPEPTTELFFSDNRTAFENETNSSDPQSIITISNHENRQMNYRMKITIQGKDQATVPVVLKNQESYQFRVPLYNQSTHEKNRPLHVRLYGDSEDTYREIWRDG